MSQPGSTQDIRDRFALKGLREADDSCERHFQTLPLWEADYDPDGSLTDTLRSELNMYAQWLKKCGEFALDSLRSGSADLVDYLLLSVMKIRQSRWDQALEAALEARRRSPQSPAVWRLLSVTYPNASQADLIAAEYYCDLILAQDHRLPTRLLASTSNNLGLIYADQGRWSTSENHIAWAMQASLAMGYMRLHATTYNSLGYLYNYQGRYEEAEAVIDTALSLRSALTGMDSQEIVDVFTMNKLLVTAAGARRVEDVDAVISEFEGDLLAVLEKLEQHDPTETGMTCGLYAQATELNDNLALANIHRATLLASADPRSSVVAKASLDAAYSYVERSSAVRITVGNEFGKVADLVRRGQILLHPAVDDAWIGIRVSQDTLLLKEMSESSGSGFSGSIEVSQSVDPIRILLENAKQRAHANGYWALEQTACSLLVEHYDECEAVEPSVELRRERIHVLTDRLIAALRMKSIANAKKSTNELVMQIDDFFEYASHFDLDESTVRSILGDVEAKLDRNAHIIGTTHWGTQMRADVLSALHEYGGFSPYL